MVWTQSNNDNVKGCLEKLDEKAQELDEKLAKINKLRKIAGKIKTRTSNVRGKPDKDGMIQDVVEIIEPKDDFGVELTDDYRLDQLSKLETATNLETGDT